MTGRSTRVLRDMLRADAGRDSFPVRLDRRIAWCSDGRLATIKDEQRDESVTGSLTCTVMPSGDVSVQALF
jgi:hypothetical protein